MSSSKAFLFGPKGQAVIWILLGIAAGCLAALGLVSINMAAIHSGSAPLLPGFQPSAPVVYGLSGAGLVALAIAAFGIGAASGRAVNAADDARRERRDQEAVVRLLDEIGALAKGDLTLQAAVTEDVTGAIAESLNDAIEALRALVAGIDERAEQVTTATDESLAQAKALIDTGRTQDEQIGVAADATQTLLTAIQSVADDARRAEEVAEQSVGAAQSGGEAVRNSIEGVGAAREQIHETSTRIKRLGESAQQIGDVVALTSDISEHTNTLALNASIQAAIAGEAGEGFAVVADEVQRLAERANAASRQVEALVHSIQTDANEAVTAMEKSTGSVANGAELAETAGQAVIEIEAVSGQLSELLRGITAQTEQQQSQAAQLSGSMEEIRERTDQTETAMRETGDKIAELAQLGTRLRESISEFTLPGDSR